MTRLIDPKLNTMASFKCQWVEFRLQVVISPGLKVQILPNFLYSLRGSLKEVSSFNQAIIYSKCCDSHYRCFTKKIQHAKYGNFSPHMPVLALSIDKRSQFFGLRTCKQKQ